MLNTQVKKLLLFLSNKNKLWDVVLTSNVTPQKIQAYTKIASATFYNWEKGSNHKPERVAELFDVIRKHIMAPPTLQVGKDTRPPCKVLNKDDQTLAIKILTHFEQSYADDGVTVYRTATDMLGMSMTDCQTIIDNAIYAQKPLFASFYYPAGRAKSLLKEYGGVYHLWVRRNLELRNAEIKNIIWLQCALRVRYVLTINNKDTIRCKLNFPRIGPEGKHPYWEYDGFLLARDTRLFWVFEKRDETRQDHFYFTTNTGRGHNGGGLTMSGKYLTTGQDDHQSIVADEMIMQRVDTSETNPIEDFMHSAVGVIEGDDGESIEKFLREFNDGVGGTARRSNKPASQ